MQPIRALCVAMLVAASMPLYSAASAENGQTIRTVSYSRSATTVEVSQMFSNRRDRCEVSFSIEGSAYALAEPTKGDPIVQGTHSVWVSTSYEGFPVVDARLVADDLLVICYAKGVDATPTMMVQPLHRRSFWRRSR